MPSQTEIQYKQRLNNFVDGVAINSAVVPNPRVYQWQCYSQMDAIRQANNYRPRIYCAPDQAQLGYPVVTTGAPPPGTGGLVPFSDYVTQLRMLPGTYVLGITLANIGPFNLQNNLYVLVEDEASGVPFFSDWIAELAFNVSALWNSTTVASIIDYVPKTCWFPLTKPRPVLSPGIVTVKMCYKGTPGSSPNLWPQVVLQCAEPCSVIRGVSECD